MQLKMGDAQEKKINCDLFLLSFTDTISFSPFYLRWRPPQKKKKTLKTLFNWYVHGLKCACCCFFLSLFKMF